MSVMYKEGDKLSVNSNIGKYTKLIKEFEEVEIIEVDPLDGDLTYRVESEKGYRVWVNEICILNPIGIKV